jgi:pimeloyl-ACP methyl ester carboxylesterase
MDRTSYSIVQDAVSATAKLNGTEIYYEVLGSGPPLVLIHGFTLDTRMWDDQVQAFAQHYQVIRYDLRGYGRSALPAGTPYTHHGDLRALLDYLGLQGAHIVGLSLGGAIAVNFAIAYPEATRSLIAVDVSGLPGVDWPEEVSRWFAGIYSAARDGDLELAKERWLATGWFIPASEKAQVAARLKQIVSDYSGWHLSNPDPRIDLDPPANTRLGMISAPTLVIVGERDLPFYNRPIADILEQSILHAQKVIIPGAGHMSNMEEPEIFNRTVLEFLAKTTAASSPC